MALVNDKNQSASAQFMFLAGGSEMAGRIRDHDWSQSPLGPMEEWSETLLATANLMLHSPFPTILSWGPEMVFLYNDAAIPTLTEKHPSALGGLYRDVFHEAWDLVRGDLEIAATCTVTYVDPKQLLACGHPILQAGPVSMPMTTTDVLATLASPLNAFKIINTGDTIGASSSIFPPPVCGAGMTSTVRTNL